MASLHHLLQQLRPFFVATNLPVCPDSSPNRLELFCDQTALFSDRIYLTDLRTFSLPPETPVQPGTILLLSNAAFTATVPPLPEGAGALLFTCPLHRLHNLMAANIADILDWQSQFQTLIDQGGGLHALLTQASRLSDGGVVLLDQQGRLMASAGLETGSYLSNQLAATGCLPQQTLERLFPADAPLTPSGQLCVPGTDLILYARRTFHGGEVLSILLMAGRSNACRIDLRTLCLCTADVLSERLFSTAPQRLGSTSKNFRQFWQDIMDRTLISAADIRDALQQTPYPPKKFVRMVVVSFDLDEAHIPYNYLITRLREFFPTANMTFWDKEIVILLSYHERVFRPTLEEDQTRRLIELLDRYNGVLMFGNGTRDLEALRSIYLLAKRTLFLTRQLSRSQPQERIFYYEDFSTYTIIDLAVQRYLEEDNVDIIYLCHPAVILLSRYDRENHTNLRDTLYAYLLNDRNLVKTANQTYMHRNTVLNKINKAISLTELDLDDSFLRQRLIFSCQLIQYYEVIRQGELRQEPTS